MGMSRGLAADDEVGRQSDSNHVLNVLLQLITPSRKMWSQRKKDAEPTANANWAVSFASVQMSHQVNTPLVHLQ